MIVRTSIVLTSNVLAAAVRFGVVAIITNSLAPGHADTLLYAYSTALTVATLSDFGLRTSLFIFSAEPDFTKKTRDWGDILLFRGIGSVFAVAAFIALMLGAGLDHPPGVFLLLALGIYAANSSLADPFIALMRGQRLNTKESALRLAENVGTLALMATLAHFAPSAAAFATALLLASLLRLAISARAGLQIVRPKFDVSAERLMALLRVNWWFGSSFVLTNALQRLPVLTLPYLGGTHSIAAVTVALMLIQSVQILSTTLAQIIIPRMVQASPILVGRVALSHSRVTLALFLVGLVASGGAYLSLPHAAKIANVDWSDAERLWIALAIPFVMAGDYIRFAVVALRRAVGYMMCQLVGLAINVVALVAFHDRISDAGVLGIFIAVLLVILVASLYLLRKPRKEPAPQPL